MSKSPRIGIFGGTFDPIHSGHLDVAKSAHLALNLSKIIFVPTKNSTHRHSAPIASGHDRLAMVKLAITGASSYRVSDQELRETGPTYTSDTLEMFLKAGTSPLQLFFIAGSDTFADITSWYNYPHILDLAHFLVVSRPARPVSTLRNQLPNLATRMKDVNMQVSKNSPNRQTWIWLVDGETRDISSSNIKKRLANGKSIAGLVPPLVATHIKQYRTYAIRDTDGGVNE